MREVGSVYTFDGEDYKLVEDNIVPEEKKQRFLVWLNIVTLVVTAILMFLHFILTVIVTETSESFVIEGSNVFLNFAIFIGSFILYIIVHELLHGIVFMMSSNKGFKSLKFGFVAKSGMAYCCSKVPVKVSYSRLSLMMPVYVVCIPMYIISLIINIPWLGLLAIILFSGSAGDIYYMWKLRKTEKELYMFEELPTKTGYQIGYLLFQKIN